MAGCDIPIEKSIVSCGDGGTKLEYEKGARLGLGTTGRKMGVLKVFIFFSCLTISVAFYHCLVY